MKRVAILGSTGSVGRQALDVVERSPATLRVVGLAAGRDVERLAAQIERHDPEIFAVGDPDAGSRLLREHPDWRARCAGFGAAAVCDVARMGADVVLNALVGYAGLRPTLAALAHGTDVALANKESMVVAGSLVRRAAEAGGARLVPVDSEHNALHQCLRAGRASEVRRLVLTASGGPFRGRTRAELERVTRADALRHPTWSMGEKITVDSATLMNKGLEILEAHALFDIGFDRIEVVVHPQSIVHSLVEFVDGSMLAQMGPPDMRLPIWAALHDPERVAIELPRLDLAAVGSLCFEPLDAACFPCVGLAVAAGRHGGTAPAVLNAANEVAVAAFLDERIRYVDIAAVIEATLAEAAPEAGDVDLDAITAADARARRAAARRVEARVASGGPR